MSDVDRLVAITDRAFGPVQSRAWWRESLLPLSPFRLVTEEYPRSDLVSYRARAAIRRALLCRPRLGDDLA
jgi:hypothetical protein